MSSPSTPQIDKEVARSWLTTAKNARKAGHWQTAYSAILQAQQHKGAASFIESARLVKSTGEPLRALQELENSMRANGFIGDDVIDVEEEDEDRLLRIKVFLFLFLGRRE
jgi:serine/threonine-protein kinase ATR